MRYGRDTWDREGAIQSCPISNIIVSTDLHSELVEYVSPSLHLLSNAEVTLKLRKCSSFTGTIEYLRRIDRLSKLGTATHRPGAIEGVIDPCNLAELRHFPVLRSDFCRFVPSIAGVAHPLTKNIRINQP